MNFLCIVFAPLRSKFTANPRKNRVKTKTGQKKIVINPHKRKLNRVPYNISAREQNNRLSLNPNLQSLANVLERVCFVAPDATDLRKLTNGVILGSRSIQFLEKVRLYRQKFFVSILSP